MAGRQAGSLKSFELLQNSFTLKILRLFLFAFLSFSLLSLSYSAAAPAEEEIVAHAYVYWEEKPVTSVGKISGRLLPFVGRYFSPPFSPDKMRSGWTD